MQFLPYMDSLSIMPYVVKIDHEYNLNPPLYLPLMIFMVTASLVYHGVINEILHLESSRKCNH